MTRAGEILSISRPQSLRTANVNPSMFVIRTRAPSGIASAAVACQISPCTSDTAGHARLDGRQGAARSVPPSRRRRSPRGAAGRRGRASPASMPMLANPNDDRKHHAKLTCSSGARGSIRIIEPNTRLMSPPAVSRPKLVTLISSAKSSRPEQNEQQARDSSPAAAAARRTPATATRLRRPLAGSPRATTTQSSVRACPRLSRR